MKELFLALALIGLLSLYFARIIFCDDIFLARNWKLLFEFSRNESLDTYGRFIVRRLIITASDAHDSLPTYFVLPRFATASLMRLLSAFAYLYMRRWWLSSIDFAMPISPLLLYGWVMPGQSGQCSSPTSNSIRQWAGPFRYAVNVSFSMPHNTHNILIEFYYVNDLLHSLSISFHYALHCFLYDIFGWRFRAMMLLEQFSDAIHALLFLQRLEFCKKISSRHITTYLQHKNISGAWAFLFWYYIRAGLLTQLSVNISICIFRTKARPAAAYVNELQCRWLSSKLLDISPLIICFEALPSA